ncbi:MAG: hypothetical protein KAQ85_11560, partial [Thermodesulfovibrionia bacterium]|nr:hypothetical protein [Thermodesulfovibrionia bacterium]
MFELIRKLFVKDEEIIEKINPDDIKGWFEAKVKVLEEEIENKLVSLRHKLLERIKSTRETLKKLECAELRNPKISTRELQFMYGNKRSYLQRTDFFLKEIGDIIDYEIGFFLIHYKEYVDNFLKSTSKSYRILQEFFANEVRDIAIAIKDLDKVVNELKADEKIHSYNQIEKIKKELISVENKISKKEELAENINAMKEELSGLKEGEDVLMKRRGQILSSDEHTAFLD